MSYKGNSWCFASELEVAPRTGGGLEALGGHVWSLFPPDRGWRGQLGAGKGAGPSIGWFRSSDGGERFCDSMSALHLARLPDHKASYRGCFGIFDLETMIFRVFKWRLFRQYAKRQCQYNE